MEFKLKIKPRAGKSGKIKLGYTLKKDQELPYQPDFEGCNHKVIFGQNLKPSMGDKWSFEQKEGWWIFTERAVAEQGSPHQLSTASSSFVFSHENESSNLDASTLSSNMDASTLSSNLDASTLSVDFLVEDVDVTYLDESYVQPNKDDLIEMDKLVEMDMLVEKVDSRIAPLKCALCNFVAQFLEDCRSHIQAEHKNWKEEIARKKPQAQTVHLNPAWKDDFKRHFQDIIIQKCSYVTREAIDNDEKIEDARKLKKVRKEILDSVVEYLVEVHGSVSNPKLSTMREIVVVMGNNYPNMFQDSGITESDQLGYGLGGRQGLKQLPEHMVDRVRSVLAKKRKAAGEVEADQEVSKKKGKKAAVYGVDNKKFYSENKNPESISAIARTNDEEDFNAREEVFARNRDALCYQFRSSGKSVGKVARKFFSNPGHLDNHFVHLTSVSNLKQTVEKNLTSQIGYMEKYLLHEDASIDFRDKMEGINTMMETDYDGASTYKDVQILRLAGTHFDQDGSTLFLLERELPAKTSSPFILVVELASGSFVFELWCDKAKLLGNLDLSAAITAFVQLCFAFNLKYPKESQTLGDLLQRRVARYGDDSGTRTISCKQTAQSKLSKYLGTLGRILSDS